MTKPSRKQTIQPSSRSSSKASPKPSSLRSESQVQHDEIEGRSFQTSILYWVGVLEELANQRFAQQMGEQKTVVGRWRTLSILDEKDGLPISQLAKESFIERTALSRMLDAMEDSGLVKRQPREDDRRTIEVFITRKGKQAFAKMLPVRRDVFQTAAIGMDEKELKALMKSIRRLVQNLSNVADATS